MDGEDVPTPASWCDDSFADDPLGLAVEQLFRASLELHGALGLITHPVAGRRVRRSIDRLDEAVAAMRRSALDRELFGDSTAYHGLTDMISRLTGGFDPGVLTDWLAGMPSADAVTVTLSGWREGDPVASASAERARRLSAAQLDVPAGPVHEARSTGRCVMVTDLWSAGERWPEIVRPSRAARLRCAYATPIRFGAEIFGSLDLYSERAGGLDVAALQAADALAVAAGIGIARCRAAGGRIEQAETVRAEMGELPRRFEG